MSAVNPAANSEAGEENKEILPTWKYATTKTAGKSLLNASLLFSNAAQLKALFDISDADRDGFWTASLVLVILSIVLQLVVTSMLLVLGMSTPKSDAHHSSMKRLNNATVAIVVVISVVNIFISAFGIQLSGSSS